jgi:hypothetical protein
LFKYVVGFLASDFHSDKATHFIYLYILKAAVHKENMLKQFPYVLSENRTLGQHSSVLFIYDAGFRKYHFWSDRFAPLGRKLGLHLQCPACYRIGTVDHPNSRYRSTITLECQSPACNFKRTFNLKQEDEQGETEDGLWIIKRRAPVPHVAEWMVEDAVPAKKTVITLPSTSAKRSGEVQAPATKRARHKAGSSTSVE